MDKGLIHIYHGDGKGKTSAAIGLALRAAGHSMKVLLVQFLKAMDSGEIKMLEEIPCIEVLRGAESKKFFWQMTVAEKELAKNAAALEFQQLIKKIHYGTYQLLILDEVLDAVDIGFLSESELVAFLAGKPLGLEVVLTGRNPSQTLLTMADYITYVQKIKHPYDQDIAARRGVEF
ncbi:MAG: cob(I)yrinic acid a,c-diamide adenosyltransferase [Clostridia bacterium]